MDSYPSIKKTEFIALPVFPIPIFLTHGLQKIALPFKEEEWYRRKDTYLKPK